MCRHYFIIETPNGRMSKGKCKYCGKTKRFCNGFPDEDAKRFVHDHFYQRTRENKVEAILSKKAKGEYVY